MKKNIILESYNKLFLEEPAYNPQKLTKEYIQRLVDEAINDQFETGMVKIAGYNLNPSLCLKKVDPLAYQEYFDSYCYAQGFEQNEDGTFTDTNAKQFAQTNIAQEELEKECCKCCGQEYICQELNPQTGYCMSCQQDELLNGPIEFRPTQNDTQQQLLIKQSCMNRWKSLNKKVKK